MTESEKRLIIDLWESRMKIADIVKMLPCDEKTAKGYIRALKDEGVLAAEKHRNANITREVIRTAYENGDRNPYELARKLHLSAYTVKDILVKLGLERQRPKRNYKKRNPTNIAKLCEKTQGICADLTAGATVKEIMEKYGVTRQYVSLIKKKYFKGENANGIDN